MRFETSEREMDEEKYRYDLLVHGNEHGRCDAAPVDGDVPLVELIYRVFTHISAGVTVGDSGFCNCCVPCPLNAVNSLHFWILNFLGRLL